MELYGTTRSRVRSNHALITPESFVRCELAGWRSATGIMLITPRMGARFAQYLVAMEAGGVSAPLPPGMERAIFVLDGEIEVRAAADKERTLGPGGYAYEPPNGSRAWRALTACRLNVFEKRYQSTGSGGQPTAVCGHDWEVEGTPFHGDPAAVLRTLLPSEPAYDMAVNVFTFEPGAALPLVEVHVMEHGLLMLEGQGVYRLGDDWYPVRQGDVIWMGPYCPQWFVAMGKNVARYLYYKDVNRAPWEDDL
jgi:(S)-ureidoglycine aminohydrolase